MSEQRTSRIGQERELPPPKDDPGMRETDDHVAGSGPGGGHQPTTRLDEGVGREHLSSASQGVRPIETSTTNAGRSPGTGDFAGGGIATGSSDLLDDEAAGGGPSGDEDAGSGPGFEDDDR